MTAFLIAAGLALGFGFAYSRGCGIRDWSELATYWLFGFVCALIIGALGGGLAYTVLGWHKNHDILETMVVTSSTLLIAGVALWMMGDPMRSLTSECR